MIAPVLRQCRQVSPARWHHLFLSMLPTIKRHAEYAFRHLRGGDLDDAVTEVVANSLVAFVRLVELEKVDLAYPTVLARYGVAQVRSGRRVGNRLAGRDVLSPQVQHRHGFNVERLDQCDEDESGWRGIVVEDRQSGPADRPRALRGRTPGGGCADERGRAPLQGLTGQDFAAAP